jgi:hypothetical protein
MENKIKIFVDYFKRISSNLYVVMMNNLSVCTFNILAPCYKHLSSEYDRESSYKSIWQSYHLTIINLLQSFEIHLLIYMNLIFL